ncbi:MAG TPA: dipeptidase [Gaiellaceae bacterium]
MHRIADGHLDLLIELAYRHDEQNPFASHWLPKLRAGGVGLQICALYPTFDETPESALRTTLEQVAAWHRTARENPDDVVLVKTQADLDAVEASDRIGLVLSVEGAEPFGLDPNMAEVYWQLGVRFVGLTWNRRNAFADGVGEPETGGLSALGCELVDRLVSLGVAIDLAHASRQTCDDVLARVTDTPVLVSHACCRALVDVARNVDDERLRAVADRGGVLGVMALPFVVDLDQPTIDRMIDHVDHAVEVMGIDGVALGGDFTRQLARSGAVYGPSSRVVARAGQSLDDPLDELEGPEDYPKLVAALERRGYTGEELERILWRNLVRVVRRALPD